MNKATYEALRSLLNRLSDSTIADEADSYAQMQTIRIWMSEVEDKDFIDDDAPLGGGLKAI